LFHSFCLIIQNLEFDYRSKVGKNRTKGQSICDAQFEDCMKVAASISGSHPGERESHAIFIEQAKCKDNDDNGCNAEANMMSQGVRVFGCGPYQVKILERFILHTTPPGTQHRATHRPPHSAAQLPYQPPS
jgi:hypothetical protein